VTTFVDGPAHGAVLALTRAPIFLRVAISDQRVGNHKIDALDLLTDTPRPGERLFAYRRHGAPGFAFVCGRSRKRGCMRLAVAEYHYLKKQPAPEIMQDVAKWRAWAAEQAMNRRPSNPEKKQRGKAE